jgi:hypothetical protein
LISQNAVQYFAGAGARHIIFTDKYDLFGTLVTRHLALAGLDNIQFT